MEAVLTDRPAFLSTLPARNIDRRLSSGIVLLSAIFFLVAVPFAKRPLPKIWAFIPIYQTSQVTNDLITAILLYGQYSILRSKALLALASGYLFVATMAVFHTLSFPGLFSSSGLLGARTQTTAWLYIFWHAGFPCFVIAYSLCKSGGEYDGKLSGHLHQSIFYSIASTILLASGFALLATSGEHLLPILLDNKTYTPALPLVVSAICAISLMALVVLWRRRPHSVLDIWLLVVLLVWCFDVSLSSLFNAGRFDLGFYAGRTYGLLAATFVLLMLLIENSRLYAQLGTAQVRLEKQYLELQKEVRVRIEAESALQRANEELEGRVRERTASLEGALKELESFSYSVSHDLKTPLRAILGLAEIIKEDYRCDLKEGGAELVQIIIDSAGRMRQLIDDLLAFSRLARKPIVLEKIDTQAMITEVLNQLFVEGQPRPTCRVQAVPSSCGERSLLRQVWENLLSNAIKFSSTQENACIEIGGYQEQAENVYFVKDNGVGFSMEYYDKLFGVFQRLHPQEIYPGTGVGLAIVQRVVTRHGGKVWADSKPNQGATFYFSLPCRSHYEQEPGSSGLVGRG
jgi:signal transduction histidine kinase